MDEIGQNQSKKPKISPPSDQEDGYHQATSMESLPRDILLDILSRLPITSLIRFRLVCRSWRALGRDPLLPHLHFNSMAAKTDPCLIFHCDYPIRNQLAFVELSSDEVAAVDSSNDGDETVAARVRKIRAPFCNSMPEFNVVGSCNGLLCLSDSLFNDPLFVFNPFTGEYVELPRSRQYQEQVVLFGFGSNPVTHEYKVVKIVYYRNNPSGGNGSGRYGNRIIRSMRHYSQSEVQVFSLGAGKGASWRCTGRVPYQLDKQAKEAAVVNGRIHWVTRPGKYDGVSGRLILSFDLEDEGFKVVPRPGFDGPKMKRYNFHLTVLKGCLATVGVFGYGKIEIWIMKEYGVKESWCKEYVINGVHSLKLPSRLHPYGIWRKALSGRVVRVLCVLKNGEVLLEYRGGNLVSYDAKRKMPKNVVFPGMPSLFQTFVHLGSLNWID